MRRLIHQLGGRVSHDKLTRKSGFVLVAWNYLQVNIFIIHVLGISTRGMKHLQFHKRYHPETGKEDIVLQFLAKEIELGKVVAKSGVVYGSRGRDLAIIGSRVSCSSSEWSLEFKKSLDWSLLEIFNWVNRTLCKITLLYCEDSVVEVNVNLLIAN